MGITIHYDLMAKNQASVDAITRKWEEHYMPELDLAGIKHRYNRVKGLGAFEMTRMEISLGAMGIRTVEDLEKQINAGKIRVLDRIPTIDEFARLVEPGVRFIVAETLYGEKLLSFLRRYTGEVAKWRVIVLFPGTLMRKPEWGVEGRDYILAPYKGFVDTPETTESFALYFVQLSPTKFYATDFIKTQAFSDEEVEPCARVHMLICDFLKDVEREGLAKVDVRDEGDFCRTGDLNTLLKSYGATMALIGRITKALTGEEGSPPKHSSGESELKTHLNKLHNSEQKVPNEIRGYINLLHLNVVGTPEKRVLPGFKEPAWLIPIRDEGTGETVKIVMGYPYTTLENYKLITVTNKLGRVITVLTLKEEAEKVEIPVPPKCEVEEAIKRAEEAVPMVAVKARIDWKQIGSIAKRIQEWLKAAEKQAEKRNSIAIYTFTKSIIDWLQSIKEKLLAEAEWLREYEVKPERPELKVLTEREYERLWQEFSKELSEENIDPSVFKERFDSLIAWNMPYEDNRAILLDEARSIILESKMKKYVKRLPLKLVRFSWKWVGWAISSLKLDAEVLKSAVKNRNVVQAYSTTAKMVEAAQKLKRLLELSPEVIEFKQLRRKSSD